MNIKDYIIKGAKNASLQLYLFNYHGESIPSKATEYLFTVNIAQELLNWKEDTDEIHLEYAAKKFKRNCFTRIQRVLGKFQFRKKHTPLRSGRIDIAIIREERSVFAIEIKAINGSNELIKKDLERLIDFLCATDSIGENSLEECYMVFFKRLDSLKKIYSETGYQGDLNREIINCQKILSSLQCIEEIDYLIETFDLDKTFHEKYDGVIFDLIDEPMANEVAEETGALVGILVSLKRKE